MTNFAYTQGIPATNDNPSDDQPNMLINNDNNFLIWNVDHIGFSQANGGIHNVIHFNNQLADPPNSAFGQLYTKTFVGNDLFYKAGGTNVISRLTNLSLNASPGLIIFPGGLTIQWGKNTSTNVAGPPNLAAVFTPAFSTAVFTVQLLVVEPTNSRRIWHLSAVNTGAFTAYIQDTNGTNVANDVYWLAIGF